MITNIHYSSIKKQNQFPNFQANPVKSLPKLACDTLEIGSKKVQTKKGLILGGILAGLLSKASSQSKEVTFDDVMMSRESGDLDYYKKNVVKFLENNYSDVCRSDNRIDLIEEIKSENSKEDIDFNLLCVASRVFDDYTGLMNDEKLNIKEIVVNQDFSTELDDLLNQKEIQTADKIIPLLKLTSKKDTEPEVLKIKQELQHKYGIKELICDNNIEFAQSCKDVFEVLNKNGIKIPKYIIANEQVDMFAGWSVSLSQGEAVILSLNPNTNSYDMDLKHIVAHEILHTTQPNTLAFKTKIIPEDMQETANNVSEYASGNYALEVHCELYVKKIFEGLSPEEEKLFNYLGGNFKQTKEQIHS